MATKEELSAAAQGFAAADDELRKAHEDLAAAKQRVEALAARRKGHETLLREQVFGALQVRTWPVWDGLNTSRASRVVVVRRYGDGVLVDVVPFEADSDRPRSFGRPQARPDAVPDAAPGVSS